MSLTTHEASIAIGMVARGDDQHDVAAWFGINQGRIADALKGLYGTTEAAPKDELPPKGAPGVKGRRLKAFAENAVAALEAGDEKRALEQLKAGLKRYNLHE